MKKDWFYYGKMTDDGQVIEATVEECGELFEKSEKRRIGITRIGDIEVSTVFLGINHGYGRVRNVWFETMVFGLDEEIQVRYETKAQAIEGHLRVVREITDKQCSLRYQVKQWVKRVLTWFRGFYVKREGSLSEKQ